MAIKLKLRARSETLSQPAIIRMLLSNLFTRGPEKFAESENTDFKEQNFNLKIVPNRVVANGEELAFQRLLSEFQTKFG